MPPFVSIRAVLRGHQLKLSFKAVDRRVEKGETYSKSRDIALPTHEAAPRAQHQIKAPSEKIIRDGTIHFIRRLVAEGLVQTEIG